MAAGDELGHLLYLVFECIPKGYVCVCEQLVQELCIWQTQQMRLFKNCQFVSNQLNTAKCNFCERLSFPFLLKSRLTNLFGFSSLLFYFSRLSTLSSDIKQPVWSPLWLGFLVLFQVKKKSHKSGQCLHGLENYMVGPIQLQLHSINAIALKENFQHGTFMTFSQSLKKKKNMFICITLLL